MKKLDARGIPYKKIELKTTRLNDNIFSDKLGMNISENGKHIGVKVGDKVYDNNNPLGIHYHSWNGDFFSPSGFK